MAIYLLLISLIQITVLYGNSCDDEWEDNVNYDVDADRVYYVGCVEELWDYAPTGKNVVTGEEFNANNGGFFVTRNDTNRIGGQYYKALYREFTDLCFTQQKERSSDELHLGVTGPNIRALTGETIKIYYKNLCSFDTSIHAHGVYYEKHSEGAAYVDDDGINGGDVVEPGVGINYGGTWIYLWYARESMIDYGTSSKMWIYHSHVLAVPEIYAGLFGAIIITRNGKETSQTNLKPKDVDREFVTFFVEFDEQWSSLYAENLATLTAPDVTDPLFIAGNRMHSINGYVYGNLDTLIMDKCDTVRWYACSLGGMPRNEQDGPHSPHWHGNNVVDTLGDNQDTIVLIPGTTHTVTMIADDAGIWEYHCHVHDHIANGMITLYTVEDNDKHCNGFSGFHHSHVDKYNKIKHGKNDKTFRINVASSDDDNSECFINEECDETADCCSDDMNPNDFGITCSSKYKRSNNNGDTGCCIKPGYACSNDAECCKKNSFCYQDVCTKLHNIPGNRRLLMDGDVDGSMVQILNVMFAVMVVVGIGIVCFVSYLYWRGKRSRNKNVYSNDSSDVSGACEEEVIEFEFDKQ